MDDPQAMFNAICDKFTVKPHLCIEADRQDPKRSTNTESSGPDWVAITVLVILMLILLVVALYCYRRSLKKDMVREMNVQVSTMIGQYYALGEGKSRKADNI